MADKKKKCPMCGTKLKMINGRMTCKDCGYYLRNQEAGAGQQASYPGQAYGGQPQGTWQTQGTGQTSSQQAGTSGRPVTSPTRGASTPHENNTRIRNTLVTGAVILVILILNLSLALVKMLSSQDLPDATDHLPSDWEKEEKRLPQTQEVTVSESGHRQDASSQEEMVSLPQSGFFRDLVEVIFDKPCSAITAQDLDSILMLEISQEDQTIYYQLAGADVMSLTFTDSFGMELSDLKTFTGLQQLYLDDDLSKGDLDGLQDLYYVYADNTIQEFTEILPHPEQITVLGVKDSIFEDSLDGIEAFPNLLYLSVDYRSLEDISALEQFPGLLGLSLTGCDRLTDYSPLMKLTSLEQLSLDSSELKSIEFIKVMPHLTQLAVEDTQISNISALADCPELTVLSLLDNYNVENYAVVGDLEKLTSLSISLGYGTALPSFQKLSGLEQLYLENANDLSPLRDASSVTSLGLKRCAGWELDAITSMQGLTTLTIHDFSSYVESLEPLTKLPNLTTLVLDNSHIFGNVEEIFGIPTLRKLSLDECQIGLDFDAIPTNEGLEILSMKRLKVLRDPTYNNGDMVSLSEHCDMFGHFPGLTQLDIASNQIDSIDFVEMLPALQYLDITDNSVTSLKPLETLPDFIQVWCKQNTILEKLPPDSPISVIMD